MTREPFWAPQPSNRAQLTIGVTVKTTPVPTSLLQLDIEERPWASFGSCRDANPDLFFSSDDRSAREAIRICRGCPVASECLAWALDTRVRYGIWGGLTERQRRRVIRQSA